MKNNIVLFFSLLFLLNTIISTSKNNNICLNTFFSQKEIFKNEKEIKAHNFRQLETSLCSSTTYSKSEIQDECDDGPSTYERILKYSTYASYISSHSYHTNGLNYVTSLFVDSETHHFGNFMNDGVGMIILYIIDGLLLLGWVPLLICWKQRCALFDNCLYEDDCCLIFWHILTYFLAAAILSFLIVVLCFGA